MNKPIFFAATMALLSLFGSAVYAAQFETIGDYTIHYNALNTEVLPPKVAKAYDIVRSKNRGLLNIAVRKKNSDEKPLDKPVDALVKASVVNLSKQLKKIEMQEIREPGAIYYIGVFPIDNADTLDFTIEVSPEGADQPHKIEFRQEFFVN